MNRGYMERFNIMSIANLAPYPRSNSGKYNDTDISKYIFGIDDKVKYQGYYLTIFKLKNKEDYDKIKNELQTRGYQCIW